MVAEGCAHTKDLDRQSLSSISGVSPSSLSPTWSLRTWVALGYEKSNGLTPRPCSPSLLDSLSAQVCDSLLDTGAGPEAVSRRRPRSPRLPAGKVSILDRRGQPRRHTYRRRLRILRAIALIEARAMGLRTCDPSAKLFDAPWVVQDASKSFGRRRTTGIVVSNVVMDLLFGIGCVCLTVARHP